MKEQVEVTTGKLIAGWVIAILVSCAVSAAVCPCARAASIWSKTYGGAGADIGTGWTVQTSDGGYAIEGDTSSFGAGGSDFWLIKTDADGNMQWNKTYGGALNEVSGDVCQTSDGGFAMAGGTYSFGAGGEDFWLVKTDAGGIASWNKTYGGTANEISYHVVQTSDGGFAMAGGTYSFGAGSQDAWLVKTDAAGNMQWNKTYGGTGNDWVVDVIKTSDGGYAMLGAATSFGAGGQDAWLIKTDSDGTMLWNMTYGGTGLEMGESIVQNSEGGYAWVGFTASFGAGGWDCWFVKTDVAGNMQWNKTYGTTVNELAIHVIQTAPEGYAMVGWNYTNGQDFLLIKTDASGNMEWNMLYGGTGVENGYALLQSSDGGYVLTGNTNSFGAGGNDIWLVKTDLLGVPEGLTIGVIMLLSTFAVIVSTRCFRKRPKIEKCSQVKL
jgi:predicted secreted protein